MKISTEKIECKFNVTIQNQILPLDKNAFNTTGISYELHLNSLQCMFTVFFHFSRSPAKAVKVVLLLKNIQVTCSSFIDELGTVQQWLLGKRTEKNSPSHFSYILFPISHLKGQKSIMQAHVFTCYIQQYSTGFSNNDSSSCHIPAVNPHFIIGISSTRCHKAHVHSCCTNSSNPKGDTRCCFNSEQFAKKLQRLCTLHREHRNVMMEAN